MKINAIKVKAGCLFSHPKERYAHFTPEVTLIASVGPNDDIDSAIIALQRKASEHIEAYKQNVLKILGSMPS